MGTGEPDRYGRPTTSVNADSPGLPDDLDEAFGNQLNLQYIRSLLEAEYRSRFS